MPYRVRHWRAGRSGTISPTELAKSLDLTTGGATTVIDRIESAGYVRRRRHPSDRRHLLVEPTAHSERLVGRVFGPLAAQMRLAADACQTGELATIAEFLARIREVTASRADQLEAGSE